MRNLKKSVSGLMAAAVIAVGVSAAGTPSSAEAATITLQSPNATWSFDVGPAHYKNERHWWKKHQQHHVLNKKQIKRKLRKWGFKNFKKVRRKGDVYVVRAHWQNAYKARLVVDAYNGRILKHKILWR